MKKYFAFIALSLCAPHIHAQTKQELLNTIDKDLNSIKGLLKLSAMRIEITPGADKTFDPKDGFNFEQQSMANPAADKEKLNDFFSNLRVHNQLIYPYNIFSIGKKEYDLLKLIGKDNFYFSHNPDKAPLYKPTRIAFLDGTELTSKLPVINKESIAAKHTKTEKEDGEAYEYVDEEKMTALEKMIWNSSSFDETMALQASKPLKSVRYSIELPVSEKKIHELDPKHKTINTAYGTITLDTIAGTKVYCTIPDMDREDDLQIEAYYKNGKVLRLKGSSSNTFVTDSKKQMYQQWISTLEEAKKQVNKNEITSEAALKAYFTAHPVPVDDNEKQSYKSSVYTFSGPVSKVVFIVTDSLSKMERFDINYDIYGADVAQEEFVATDFETEKNGLLNKTGKWIVQPQFNAHFRPLNRYFYWDQYDDTENTYHYNPSTKAIQKVDYKIDDREIYNDKYVKICSRTNGPKGIVDASSGKIILPVSYDYIRFKSEKFWQIEQEEKKGVLDKNFKTILPIAYDELDIEGDYILAKNEGSKEDIYTAGGRNITQGKYDDLKGAFNDGLLLVGKRDKTKEGYTNTKYYYIDTLCRVKIDVTAKGYKDPEAFSSGMAVVKNTNGDYGYINIKGDLAIAYQYKYARYFYPSSQLALITLKDNTCALVDKKGNIVKKLPGSYIKGKFKPADRKSRILMENQRSFNEYGEELDYDSNDYW